MASIPAGRSASARRAPATSRSPLWLLLLLCSTMKTQGSDAQTVPDVIKTEASAQFNVLTLEELYVVKSRQCWFIHEDRMKNISRKDWCEWDMISRPYSELQGCLEKWAEIFKQGFPNPCAEQIIFYSHQMYFANCSLERRPVFFDPPEEVLLALIIAPICLIPFLVTLVVWRSKDSEVQT